MHSQIIDETSAHNKRPASQQDLCFTCRLNGFEAGWGKRMQNLLNIKRGAYRGYCANSRYLACGHQCRSATQAMADEQSGRLVDGRHGLPGGDQIRHVSGEGRIGEASFAPSQTGKVESQDSNTAGCQRAGYASRRQAVLSAGETVRHDCPAPWCDVRMFYAARKAIVF